MPNAHEVLTMPAANIEAFTNILKVVAALSPISAAVISAVVGAGIFVLKRNTKVTKANTETTEEATALLDAHKKAVEKMQKEMNDTVHSFNAIVANSMAELIGEINKVKIVVVKVNAATDNKLSGIPKVQDAVTKLTAKVDGHEADFKLLKNLTDRLKERKPT